MADGSYTTLFTTLEAHFQRSSFPDKWPILAITTLAASYNPDQAHNLYLYLLTKPEYNNPDPTTQSESRKALVRRLREALVKAVPIIGICKCIEAILSIARVEKEEDKDYSAATRENWQCDEANHARAQACFQKLYRGNANATLDLFAAHKDFAWLSMEITYGLFLADRQVLDEVDAEMVVMSGIVSQDLRPETHWHVRGMRRLGVAIEDVRVVWECTRIVAGFHGVELKRIPTVDEVELDV